MSSHVPSLSLRAGVVGCSASLQAYAPALASLDSVDVSAITDPDPASARAWSRQIGSCRTYADYDELLANAEIDAVIVVSPPEERHLHVLGALSAGKHILSEVPLARTPGDYAELAARAANAGLVLMPAHVARYEPALRQAFRSLREGAIGEPRDLRCEWAFYTGWAQRRSGLRNWQAVVTLHAVQTLDVARWWLGEPLAVSADIDTASDRPRRTDIANVIVQHERGVSVHHIYRSARPPRYEQYILTGSEGVIEVVGPAAGAIDRSGALKLTLRRPGQEALGFAAPTRPILPVRRQVRWVYRDMLDDFARAVSGFMEPAVQIGDAIAACSLLEAAMLSSFDNLKVQLPLSASRAITAPNDTESPSRP